MNIAVPERTRRARMLILRDWECTAWNSGRRGDGDEGVEGWRTFEQGLAFLLVGAGVCGC